MTEEKETQAKEWRWDIMMMVIRWVTGMIIVVGTTQEDLEPVFHFVAVGIAVLLIDTRGVNADREAEKKKRKKR